jgi:hypothetical protein
MNISGWAYNVYCSAGDRLEILATYQPNSFPKKGISIR